jgi:uncharacterized membrane protein YkvA (DUF1232 family)
MAPPAPPTPKEFALFTELCSDLPPDGLAELCDGVRSYASELEAEQATSELVAVDLAIAVVDRLERLFELATQLPAPHRALVVGAARYFISKDDAIPDTRACTGLDDDVRIVNHVLKELGRAEWSIEE